MDFDALARAASKDETYVEARTKILELTAQNPSLAFGAIRSLANERELRYAGMRRGVAGAIFAALVDAAQWGVVVGVCSEMDLVNYLGRSLIFEFARRDTAIVDGFLDLLDPSDLVAVRVGSELNQERLMRAHQSTSTGRVLHQNAQRAGLPVGWLPEELHDLEKDHRCLLAHGGGQTIPSRQLEPKVETVRSAGTLRDVLSERSLFPNRTKVGHAIYAAHEPAIVQSNGKAEATKFGLISNLDWWATPGIDYDADAFALEPFQAAAKLFSVNPGAYSPNRNAWEARFSMGRVLSVFVGPETYPSAISTGAQANATFLSILDRVPDCEWFGFEPDPAWAHQVAWDFGLLCVNGDGALSLVATDTD